MSSHLAAPNPPPIAEPRGAAALASIGAGTIHAAAAAAHADHRQAMLAFVVTAVCQVGWGALALAGAGRRLLFAGMLGNAGVLAGWLTAKTTGISFVDGLEQPEAVQVADGLAAALALVAVTGILTTVIARGVTRLRAAWRPQAAVLAGLVMAATSAVGIAEATSHSHGGAHDAGHGHAHSSAVPARPYDPAAPIDLGGVEGVTPEQQARAENLVAVTLFRLPRYADAATAEADGFRSVGDAGSGYEHLINWAYVDDDRTLDPDHPESLVYRVDGGSRTLVAAMYMLRSGTALDEAPELGGRLTQWHVHDDLCFTDDPAGPVVASITAPDSACPPPQRKRADMPMIHVWTVPHECGPFAALEGLAGGQVAGGEQPHCDHAHGSS